MRKSSWLRIPQLLIAFALVAALSSPIALGQSQGTIAYLIPWSEDIFWVAAYKAVEDEASRLGYDVRVLDAANHVLRQANQFDDVIAQRPAAILLSAVDTRSMYGEIEKARAEGIPVIIVGRPMEIEVDLTVITGTVETGRQSAEAVVELLKDKNGSVRGVVLEVMGDSADSYSVEVGQGFHEVIDHYENVRVISKPAEGWDPVRAANIVADQLTLGNVDVVFLHSDWLATGVVPYLRDTGYGPVGEPNHVHLVATTGVPEGLQYTREGMIDVIIEEPITAEAVAAVQFTDKLLRGQSFDPGTVDIMERAAELTWTQYGPLLVIPGGLITPENAGDPSWWGNIK